MGRGPVGARDHHRGRPGDAGRRRAAGRGAAPGWPAAAVVGVGPTGHPATGRRGRAVVGRDARSRPVRWPPAGLTATVRAAAGVPVAAVLLARDAAGRHPAQLQDRPRGGGAGGPGACCPVSGVAGGEGAGHRGQRACWARRTARALAARGDQVTVLQRRPAGLGLPEVLADIADAAAVRRGRRPGRTRWSTSPPRSTSPDRGRSTERANIVGTAAVVDACRAAGVARLVHVSSPSVAHAGDSLVGAAAGPADPAGARGAVRAEQGRGRAAGAGGRRGRAGRGRHPAASGLGTGRPPADRTGRGSRPGRPAVLVGSGAALIDTTYVDNAVDALVCGPGPVRRRPRPGAGGEQRRAPADRRADRGDLRRRRGRRARARVPAGLAYAAGAVVEGIWAVRALTPAAGATRR